MEPGNSKGEDSSPLLSKAMDPGNGREGDSSPIFSKATITTNRRRDLSCGAAHSESIVHRLNHLSLLINSSGIDLNIALDESLYESAEAAIASEDEDKNSEGNDTLASLSSQSTKRRSLMPPPSQPETVKDTKNGSKKMGLNNVSASYMCKDGLLDAFLTLYDECCTNDKYKKDPLVQNFVKKYQPYAAHLSKLRISLADFECVRVIGRGHFGVVQLIKEISSGNVYALKTLKKDETLQLKHVAFFEEERDIMAKATSPWITKLQYAFQDARHLHLVMEYHPGGDLLSLMERHHNNHGTRCLPEDWVVFYLAQTTTALHHLHNMGYVHRDVKPENLLLDRCGHIKLADFGSSCRLSQDGSVTASLPAGTPDYLAPEVLADVNSSASYGAGCDFWSAGVVAYEMLYGCTPFASDKIISSYSNIMQHQSSLRFPSPPAVSDVAVSMVRALVCDAAQRLDYRGITRHPFFLHCNFQALHLMVPPFIPSVSGPDDSSNFDSFGEEAEMSGRGQHSMDVSSSKAPTLPHRVPFVGFTFVRPPPVAEEPARCLDTSDSSVSEELTRLRSELHDKKKQLHQLQLQMAEASDSVRPEAEARVQKLESDRLKLKAGLAKREAAIQALKEQLVKERADRAAMETRTLALVRDIKAKWKKEEELKLGALKEECELWKETLRDEHQKVIEQTTEMQHLQQQQSVLQQQLQHCKQQARQKDQEIVKLKEQLTSLKEAATATDAATSDLALTKAALATTTEERDVLRDRVALLESQRDEKVALEAREDKLTELQAQRDRISALEAELSHMQKTLDETETKSFEEMQRITETHDKVIAVKQALVQELQFSLKVEQQERSQQSAQLRLLQQQVQEARTSQAQMATELHVLQESKHEELQAVNKQLDATQHLLQEEQRKAQHSATQLQLCEERVAELQSAMKEAEARRAERQQSGSELQSLAEQLSRAREAAARAEENVKITSELLEQERSLASRLRLDVKVAERELRGAREKIDLLRECARDNREALKSGQDALQEKELQVQQMQQRIAELEEQLSVAHQAAASQLTQHQEAVQEAQAQVTLLQQKLASNEGVAADLTAATRQIEDIKVDKQEVERKLQEALQEASGLQRELQERDVQITKLQEGTALLKDLCSEQDEQLAQLDTLDERMQLQRQQREKLEEQVQSLQCEVKAAKAQVNEEKSLKVFQERQVKTLQAQLQQQEATHQQEQDALNKHCDEYAASNSKLLLRLSELEKELFSTEATVQALEESAEVQKEQLEALQQEAQGHIKHIQALKDTNFQLTQGLEEAIEKGQLYKRKMTELAGHLEEEREVMRDKELRTKMTTEQQTKLIDFLHAKLDDSNKKKSRTLSSKLFGGRDKENQSLTPYKSRSHLPTPDKCTLATTPHPNATPLQHSKLLKTSSTPPQSHKTPSTLLPQSSLKPPVAKTSSAQFATPMNEFKTPKVDLRTPKVDFKTPKVGTSNASVAAGAEGTPTTGRSRELASRQRIRHDIPHRFERSMIVQVGRCSGCLSSVPRGRFAYRCSHCGAVAHKHCTTGVPATCGLPQQLAQHFTHNTQTAKVLHEGWVKIPKASKACWEFCFTRLLSNGDLLVFDHEPSDAGDCSLAAPPSCNAPTSAAGVAELQPTSTISLCVPNCRLEVVSAVPRSEIPATSTVDLPYVFKVDVLRGYQQSIERLYLMTSNFEQKQRWVAALEHVAQQCGDSVSVTGDSNVRVLPLLQLPASSLTPNTLIFIHDDVCLLGCEVGLVSCSVEGSGELLKKARLGSLSAVQQLLDIPTAQRVAVIAGEDRSVYLLPHATLLGAARHCSADEPNVPHEAVAALSGVRCHLLATGVTTNGATFMCAAAEDRVSILVWDTSSSQLQVVRQYGTQEACTSCLFTPAALIVAADKLYEIDLTSFSIEEFLDESDTSLAYAVYGTARLSSYPLAILQVSESGKYGEFLICFNEFALFVDPYGQRSREHDIKFTRVPIAIEYCDGKLYLLHSNCIEVLRITSDSFTKVTSSQTGLDGPEFDSSSLGPSCLSASMPLSQPHLIGKRAGGVVVRCEGEQGSLDVLQLIAEFPSAALSGSWSSLPSAITTASSDIADITSETSGSHSVGEKRKQDGKPAASSSARAPAAPAKRSKQDLAH